MEVIEARSALLSNYEVLTVLLEQRDSRPDGAKQAQNVKTMEYEALEYLSRQPCGSQTPEQVSTLLSSLSEFALTKAERLNILNLRPTELVELHPIIEELDERLSEEQAEKLLTLVTEALPRDEFMEEEGDEEEEDTMEDVSPS